MIKFSTKAIVIALMASIFIAKPTWAALPAASSDEFCRTVQQLLASTDMVSNNTIYEDLEAFRKSKPGAEPLQTYQMLSWDGELPITVSCKVKTADNLRYVYGENAAGAQQYCPYITRQIMEGAEQQLLAAGEDDAASRLQAFVLDRNEPYMTGSSYLSSYAPVYTGDDGRVHIASPGLMVYWDSFWRYIMPDILVGQTYCHLVTADYLMAVARGERDPGASVSFDLPES